MFSFTQIEKRDLLLGTLIFVLVELSSFISFFELLADISSFLTFFISEIIILSALCVLTVPLFLFHELSHKFSAQGYGLSSEFRLDPTFALFSLASIFLTVKIIAPGVVLSTGEYQLDTSGRISMAGPLTNILIGGVFLAFISFMPFDWAVIVLLYVSKFSFDLALFNMLPFYVLDGTKVLRWDKAIFALIFSLSLILWLFHPLGIFGRMIVV